MSVYTVHMAEADLERPLAAGQAVYVREGFSWGAFLIAPLWCLWRRSWLGLALWIVALAVIAGLGRHWNVNEAAQAAAVFVVHLLFGWEAAQLHRRSLRRRGYRAMDIVAADRKSEAEMVFVSRYLAVTAAASAPGPVPRPRPLASSDSLGLAPMGGGA